MPRPPRPLPPELSGPFTVADAAALGVAKGRMAASDLRAPFRGVRVRNLSSAPSTLLARCTEYAPRLREWQFFSHETALAGYGAPTPAWPYTPSIHVSAHRPAREPRVSGVTGHRLQLREPAQRLVEWALQAEAGGSWMLLEDPVRAWRQTGTLWPLDDLVAASDFLVSGDAPLATMAELREEVLRMGDVRGGILRGALNLTRTGVRSARETKLRLVLVRAGLPEPEVAWRVRDTASGRRIELDLAYPRWLVAPEYDGRVHAEDAAQFARDADRWALIRSLGWQHVRVLNHHMKGGGAAAVRLVRDALLRAGWRPGH